MAEYHARSREAHYVTYFFPHLRLIAMNAAVGAEGFCFHKGTLIAPHHSVLGQFLTFGTKSFFRSVLPLTVKADHQGDRAFFPLSL